MQETNDVTNNNLNLNDNGGKQHFINDEKFKLLKQYQHEIFLTTEVSPTIRMLVNELINEENLNRIKSKFVDIFSSR